MCFLSTYLTCSKMKCCKMNYGHRNNCTIAMNTSFLLNIWIFTSLHNRTYYLYSRAHSCCLLLLLITKIILINYSVLEIALNSRFRYVVKYKSMSLLSIVINHSLKTRFTLFVKKIIKYYSIKYYCTHCVSKLYFHWI